MISSVMSQGLYGMQKSQSAMVVNAQEIAQAGAPSAASVKTPVEVPPVAKPSETRELADSLTDLKQQQNLFDASAKMVAVGNRTLGSLLDATA